MHSAVSHKQSGDSASVASSAALTGLSTESLSISASLGEVPDQNLPKRCVIICNHLIYIKNNLYIHSFLFLHQSFLVIREMMTLHIPVTDQPILEHDNCIFSGSVDVGEDVADDAEVVEASSSPQSNGK